MALREFVVDREFVELHSLLKLLDYAGSGGEAKAMVADGLVRVDGTLETRKTRKLLPGQRVQIGKDIIKLVQG